MTALESRWWRTSIVGVVPEIHDLHIPKQMEWASHMGIPAVILPPIPTDPSQATEYARIVASASLKSSASNGQLWIRTPLTQEGLSAFAALHKLCDGLTNVGMMLAFDVSNNGTVATANPTAVVASQVTLVHKAIGSQLKALSFPSQAFLTNKRGYPALSKTHQVLFTEILRRVGRTIRVQVEGPSHHTVVGGNAGGTTECLPYLQYIRHIRARPEVQFCLDTDTASLEEPYLDHLQRPLQPLGDHLEFGTYENFEKDPVKYTEYQKAIGLALRDNLVGVHNKNIIIVIAGAGRGPLVNSALKAIQTRVSMNVHPSVGFVLYAVEKNPSAIVYLESMARHEPSWKGVVQVVKADMRTLTKAALGGQQADIVVSELLGSFGDNELSPECLDALYASGLMKDSTICIPSHYTSYLAPVSSFRLHSEARAQSYFPNSTADGLDSSPMGSLKAMETPYVVRSHAACQTHAEQACWEFGHPSPTTNRERVAHVEFRPDVTHGAGCGAGYGLLDQAVASMAQATATLVARPVAVHGFLGTFTAVLYSSTRDDSSVSISTRPTNYSRGMFSWFPLYFPIRESIQIPSGGTLVATLWRKCAPDRVWYEWCARAEDKDGETTAISAIHNPNGRSYHVSL